MTEQEKYREALTTVFSRGQDKPLEFPIDEMRTKITKIKNYSVSFNGIEIAEIISTVNSSIQEDKLSVLDAYHKIGWQVNNGDITGWKSAASFDMQGNQTVKDICAPYPAPSGDLEQNISFLKNYLSTHSVIAQAILLYGLSAVLAGYFGKCLLLSVAGKSSRGKTTLAKFIISLFADPNNQKLSTTFNVTLNKMTERLDGINGTAVLIDDLSLAPDSVKKSIDSMIYILDSGKEKERINTKTFDRKPATWATTIILSAEEPLLELCDPEKEGTVGRLMELTISPDDLFNSAEDATNTTAVFSKHYGLVADEFVRRLITEDKLNKLPALYEKEIQSVRKDYSGPMARMAENVAMVTLTGRLFNEFFDPLFRVDEIQEYLMSVEKDNLENSRLLQRENIIMSKIYPDLIAYGKEACAEENKNFSDRVVISSKAMKEILSDIQKQYGYKPKQVKQALKDGKVLLPYVALPGVGEQAARQFYEAYIEKPYETIEEAQNRSGINESVTETFKAHGIFKGLPETDQLSLF